MRFVVALFVLSFLLSTTLALADDALRRERFSEIYAGEGVTLASIEAACKGLDGFDASKLAVERLGQASGLTLDKVRGLAARITSSSTQRRRVLERGLVVLKPAKLIMAELRKYVSILDGFDATEVARAYLPRLSDRCLPSLRVFAAAITGKSTQRRRVLESGFVAIHAKPDLFDLVHIVQILDGFDASAVVCERMGTLKDLSPEVVRLIAKTITNKSTQRRRVIEAGLAALRNPPLTAAELMRLVDVLDGFDATEVITKAVARSPGLTAARLQEMAQKVTSNSSQRRRIIEAGQGVVQ